MTVADDIRKLLNLVESLDSVISNEMFLASISKIMNNLVTKYQQYTVPISYKPSSPNTQKFTGTVNGTISFERNVSISGGTYGFDRMYQVFVKIGSGVPVDIKKQMRDDFINQVKQEFNLVELTPIQTSNGSKFYFREVNGSSWGGFGFFQKDAQ